MATASFLKFSEAKVQRVNFASSDVEITSEPFATILKRNIGYTVPGKSAAKTIMLTVEGNKLIAYMLNKTDFGTPF